MKFAEINKKFTEKVAEYMAQGWHINTATMGGSQGEISKIDLTDGKDVIRILLESKHSFERAENERHYSFDYIQLTVGKASPDDCIVPNSPDHWGTLWNHHLEVLSVEEFYELNHFASSDKTWYGTREEACAQQDKARKRYNAQDIPETVELSDKAKEIVLPLVRRQPGCKTVKLSEITVCKRFREEYGRTHSRYTVTVRKTSIVLK